MAGRFGIHGGQYIPETLMNAVIELEQAYNHYKNDNAFNQELEQLFNEYAGRPSRLYYASRMTQDLNGAKIYLKREDLNHTGARELPSLIEVTTLRAAPSGWVPASSISEGVYSLAYPVVFFISNIYLCSIQIF